MSKSARSFRPRFASLLGVTLTLAFTISPIAAAQSAAQSTAPLYIIDPIETHARFETLFLGFITVRGKFNRTTGTLNHDPDRSDAPSRASDAIYAVIDSTTLDAHVVNAYATNKTLRGPEFFNVDKFPTIEFKSSRFVWVADRLMAIEGSLQVVGVIKPVTLTVLKSGCSQVVGANGNVKRARCIADAFLNIKRSDYGMKAWSGSVSDNVKIIVELVAYAANEQKVEHKNGVKSDSKNEIKNDPHADPDSTLKTEQKPEQKAEPTKLGAH